MGFLASNKHKNKSSKPPIPAPACWIQRIDSLQNNEDVVAVDSKGEQELMQQLQQSVLTLVNHSQSAGSTWLSQSTKIKEITTQLTKLQRLPSISLSTLVYLRQAAIPLFVECFFLAPHLVVKRQTLPLIKAANKLDPTTVDAQLQHSLLLFIGAQDRYPQLESQEMIAGVDELCGIYSQQTIGQRCQAIDVLARTVEGKSLIETRFVSDILAFSAGGLEQNIPLLQMPVSAANHEDSNDQQQSLEYVTIRDDCVNIMRMVFLCLSRLVRTALADNSRDCNLKSTLAGTMRTPLPEFADSILALVDRASWDLLACDQAPLNARQIAAMALVHLVEGAGYSTVKERAAALADWLLAIGTKGVREAQSVSETIAESRKVAMDDPVSMVCLAKAIVTLGSYETTLTILDFEFTIDRNPGDCNTVHEACFTHIASICGRSHLAPGVKVIVFDSMACWLQETAKLLREILPTSSEDKEKLRSTAFLVGKQVLSMQRERIMGYLWSYWDDPLFSVQVKVKSIFEAFLDIGSALNTLVGEEDRSSSAFLDDVLELVMSMDWSRKVKYALLATLCPRINVLDLLQYRHPETLSKCMEVMSQVALAPRIATLITALLDRVKEDIEHDQNLEYVIVDLWTTPVAETLCKEDPIYRRMMACYLLPRLFEAMPATVGAILRALAQDLVTEQSNSAGSALDISKQHALIVVLKAARALDMITMDQLVDTDPHLLEMLKRAVCHPDWSVRADLMGLLCESRKQAVAPHDIEYQLLFRLMKASSNSPSADFRQLQIGYLTNFASRLATAAHHSIRIIETGRRPVPSQRARHRDRKIQQKAIAKGANEGKAKEEVLRELGVLPEDELVAKAKTDLHSIKQAVEQWLALAVRGCLYPKAGFAKTALGLKWLHLLLNEFAINNRTNSAQSLPFKVRGLGVPDFKQMLDGPSELPMTTDDNSVSPEETMTALTQVLIGDLFESNRLIAYSLLVAWPLKPAEQQVNNSSDDALKWANSLLQQALRLVASTRADESVSGALIIRWLFRKFVIQHNLILSFAATDENDIGSPAPLEFARKLLRRIQQCQQAAENNLLDAAQNSPLHGLLTAAHYVADEIDYTHVDIQQNVEVWRQWLSELSETASAICDTVMNVLTNPSPEGNVPASFRDMEDKIGAIIRDSSNNTEEVVPLSGDVELDGPVGPKQQVILSYCWRAIKELSGLLAAVAINPPGSDQSSSTTDIKPLVSHETINFVGSLLRSLLTSIRHRGAFSAVHPAFTQVCGRMFRSPMPELHGQISNWLEQCVDEATIRRVSITRRSAGWPLCLLSLLTCDKHATQALLPRAMDRLFVLASDLLITEDASSADGTTDLPQVHAINMMRVLLDDHTLGSDIVPYVERAYVLALLGLRSSHWAIRNVCSLLYAALTSRVFGNSQPRDDEESGEDCIRYGGITGRELFTRFPGLHPFLSNQLEDAVDRLAEIEDRIAFNEEGEKGEGKRDVLTDIMRSGARFIHPALYPCLILLARLQPSPLEGAALGGNTINSPSARDIDQQQEKLPSSMVVAEVSDVVSSTPHYASATGAVAPPMSLEKEPLTGVNERDATVHVTSAPAMLSMYSFTELVEVCVESPVFKTREMAARAYAPLVPSEQVLEVVCSLLQNIRNLFARSSSDDVVEDASSASSNTCHGTLCQVHELLKVFVRQFGDYRDDRMQKAFISQVVPALTALWPLLISELDRTRDHQQGSYTGELNIADLREMDVTDVIRHKYLTIVNEFVARAETWLFADSESEGYSDDFGYMARLTLSRFRLSMLYGTLHPLLSDRRLLPQLGSPQILGAYGTVLELTRLFLACVDDQNMAAVVQQDGSVQLSLTSDDHVMDQNSERIMYNSWNVLSNLLANNTYYEAKMCVLEWLIDHAEHHRLDIFERIDVNSLLPYLIADVLAQPLPSSVATPDESGNDMAKESDIATADTDPMVRAASIRLLTLLCRRMELHPQIFPVPDMLLIWDAIVAQIEGDFCALSVSVALTELQAALLHVVYKQYAYGQETNDSNEEEEEDVAGLRALAWAKRLYEWSDSEYEAPYRWAVAQALVTYSAIKRYGEAVATTTTNRSSPVNTPPYAASEELLRLCYWRMLQDDDEDIREFVAESISSRLGQSLACDQACERLVYDFMPNSNVLPFPVTYVWDRLDFLARDMLTKESVQEFLLSRMGAGSSRLLFDHESPNIYIDEPRNSQLAYYSLVVIADSYANCAGSTKQVLDGAMKCVDALETTYETIAWQSTSGEMVFGATCLPDLFIAIDSWIQGARLALFVASVDGKKEVVNQILNVARSWIENKDIQPLHPWVARSLVSLADMCQGAIENPITKERAIVDLHLLTYI